MIASGPAIEQLELMRRTVVDGAGHSMGHASLAGSGLWLLARSGFTSQPQDLGIRAVDWWHSRSTVRQQENQVVRG
jgi:hypothetical protein